ncbi:MAG TPA: nitrate/sulfonate/bicarbonate ABC transporter ATP-binding protein [Anaerolineae bacterium]|nr:nitrate/sulfonate/bicarbonate ABC transporter ATP-binding protein [Anaerolineae bacterium]
MAIDTVNVTNNNGGAAPLLELKDVTRQYGKPPKLFTAVKDVNFVIRPEEFVCLLGPSGCGKSTLLRMITGLNPVSSGKVLYKGEPQQGVNPHATIVFQTFALYPWLTVQQNVEVALKARGVAEADRHKKAAQLLDKVGLDGFESAYPRELSGGMRQKVGFARAMAVEPQLFCLDEPFSALDVLSAEALRGELLELWISKSIPTEAVLMVTHNIEEAVFLADRIIVMEKDPGRVLAEVNVTLRHPRNRKDTAFQALVDKVYGLVAGRTEPETDALGTAPGTPGQTKALPVAVFNRLAGLLEAIDAEQENQVDLYRLAEDLNLELDDILPIVEGAEVLGFATVDQGDMRLTPLGEAFATASIVARKEILAGRVMRLPIIRWIYETLQKDDNQRIAEDYFVEQLQTDFGDYAKNQLDIAVDWGRYAELFAYDENAGELYLDEDDAAK